MGVQRLWNILKSRKVPLPPRYDVVLFDVRNSKKELENNINYRYTPMTYSTSLKRWS